ncbi:MAG: aminoacyl-tRNA hydrolase [Chitinophagales bacterium]|nr:aminoacyl-tRNA hydrolase [Chitinophagales bacterium]MDW8392647.1 aminoacyl-tRNA hydrolase [Chitinophagales bacterium]
MTFLIAGLGNIGQEYLNSRHNIGFLIADAWVQRHRSAFENDTLALHARLMVRDRQVHVIKPTTYMNRSGRAVRYWQQQLQVPLNQLLVVVDDLALPFGTLRLRSKGSDGQHNGLTSVQQELQTTAYPRLRVGIGSDFPKGQQVNYVLGNWSPEQQIQLPHLLTTCCDVLDSFVWWGLEKTMNRFNRRPKPPASENAQSPSS